MKKLIVVLSMLGVVLFAGSAFASMEEQLRMVENFQITAVKSMQVVSGGGSYYLDLVVQMRNTNERDIRLKDCDFKIKLGSDKYSPRYIGKAKPSSIELGSATSDSSPSTDVQLKVKLGSKQDEVLDKLAYVMNIVGNPATTPLVLVDGEANPSVKAKNGGWVRSGSRLPIEDLPFHPKVQKEVLLQ